MIWKAGNNYEVVRPLKMKHEGSEMSLFAFQIGEVLTYRGSRFDGMTMTRLFSPTTSLEDVYEFKGEQSVLEECLVRL